MEAAAAHQNASPVLVRLRLQQHLQVKETFCFPLQNMHCQNIEKNIPTYLHCSVTPVQNSHIPLLTVAAHP